MQTSQSCCVMRRNPHQRAVAYSATIAGRKTHPVASQNEEVVIVAQGRLGRVRRANDELLHLRVTERARDGKVPVHALVRDIASGGLDALHLLRVAGLVIVRQSDRATTTAASCSKVSLLALRAGPRAPSPKDCASVAGVSGVEGALRRLDLFGRSRDRAVVCR